MNRIIITNFEYTLILYWDSIIKPCLYALCLFGLFVFFFFDFYSFLILYIKKLCSCLIFETGIKGELLGNLSILLKLFNFYYNELK